MDSKNNWNEISKDFSKMLNKAKNNFDQTESVDDLKKSFYTTVESSIAIVKNLSESIEQILKDEEIKSEVKEIINSINRELSQMKNQVYNNLSFGQDIKKTYEEE